MTGDKQKQMKPNYYKTLWHNCNRCRIHYTSDDPQLKAYLCDECWNTIPHFVVQAKVVKKPKKKDEWTWKHIVLYTMANMCTVAVIIYYLLFKQEK